MTTTVPCPNCRKRSPWSTENPFRPFCSKRCKLADLGDWFDGSHHIAGPELPQADVEEIDPRSQDDDYGR